MEALEDTFSPPLRGLFLFILSVMRADKLCWIRRVLLCQHFKEG